MACIAEFDEEGVAVREQMVGFNELGKRASEYLISFVLYYRGHSLPFMSCYRCDSLPDFEAIKECLSNNAGLNDVSIVDSRQVFAITSKEEKING